MKMKIYEPPRRLRVFLIDDEPLAVRRLSRLLNETGRVEIAGSATDSAAASREISQLVHRLDALFLDVQMPGLNGFELLARLEDYPPVVFTTAFDEYAVRAFEVHSIDYLLKPVTAQRLVKTVEKLEKRRREKLPDAGHLQQFLTRNAAGSFAPPIISPPGSARLSSRVGGRVQFVETTEITHFAAEDKLTFAVTADGKRFPLDFSLAELERKFGEQNFTRIHRNALVNQNFIDEVLGWFSGRVSVRLNDCNKTELAVARDRVKTLKDSLKM